jgi:glycosyltransferase involved in cell wall biosynthesis
MSVYNAERYVGVAVESILAQTLEDFEFIIIDDGSTDGSGDVIARYAARDERIRLVRQANRGLTPSLNRGLDAARAPLVARMDADDVAHPERLERQVAFLEAHPEHVLVGGQVDLIDGDGAAVREGWGYETLKDLPLDHETIDRMLLQVEWPLVHPAVTMRRQSVAAAGAYDERYVDSEDHDLFLRMAEAGRLANLPATVLQYRRHSEQVTRQNTDQSFFQLQRIARAAYRRRGRRVPHQLRYLGLRQALRRVPRLEQSLVSLKRALVG